MKNLKTVVIYVLLAALCFFAFAAYIGHSPAVQGKSSTNTVTAEKSPANSKSKTQSVVGVYRGTDYAAVTKAAIDNAGGLGSIIKKGATVLIKPNLGAPPFGPDDTDYRVVQEIVRICKESGAGKIIIAEGSYTGGVFKMANYTKIEGVEFIDTNELGKADCYHIKAEKSLTNETFYIPKVYMDANVVISAAKLKTYSLVGATLSLKNVFGVPPATLYGGIGAKTKLHSLGVEECIVDLNKIRRPDFAVIDGIVGGEGPGPFGNSSVKSNIVLAGADPVSVDAAAAYFMGFNPGEVNHINMAAEAGIGIADLNKIKVVGADLKAIRMQFDH